MLTQDPKTFGRGWMERLGNDALAQRVLAALSRGREEHASPVLERARRENPVMDAVIAGDLDYTRQHVLGHSRALLTLPTERAHELGDDPFAFVRAHGVRRARGGVPLLAVLQSYRSGHKAFWAAICDMVNRFAESAEEGLRTTMLLSDYCIEYTDLISIVVTDAYVAEEALLAAQRTRLRIAVLEDLLRGEPPRMQEALDLCEGAGIGHGRAMVVMVARRAERAGEPPFPVRERSALAQRIDAALPQAAFGRLIDLRRDEVVGVISAAQAPGAAAADMLRRSLAAALEREIATRIGIGLDVAEIAALPRSYAEALCAIDILGPAHPVAFLAEANLDAYLRYSADATARRLAAAAPQVLADGKLVATLEAFAAASLNVKACAKILQVHNNTVYHRLNSVRRLTGTDPRSYAGLTHLLALLSVGSGTGAAARPPQSSPPGECGTHSPLLLRKREPVARPRRRRGASGVRPSGAPLARE